MKLTFSQFCNKITVDQCVKGVNIMAGQLLKRCIGAALLALILTMLLLPAFALGATYPTLRLNDQGDDVLKMQTALKEQGYYTGSLTGHFGAKTEEAVKKFQKKMGLGDDGIAGEKTLSALYGQSSSSSSSSTSSSSGVLKEGVTSDAVLQLQTNLNKLGYYSGSLTGHFGSKTGEAVRAFQKAYGLTADGIAGAKTLAKISEVISGSSSSTSSTSSTSTTTTSASTTTTSTSSLDLQTTLKLNSKSNTVTAVQTRLKELNYYTGNVTGNYGEKTMAAVKAFQQKNGLTADGLAGPKTLAAIFSATASSSTGSTTGSSVSASKVQNVNWYTMRGKYDNGIIVTVYDFSTGYSWKLKTMSKDKHWDMEPVSSEDVTTMYKAFGNKTTWTPKAVWVTFPDGATYIAATVNTPHGTYHITDNNFKGHLCVHFPLSMSTAESIGSNAVNFQKAIVSGWEATQKLAAQ